MGLFSCVALKNFSKQDLNNFVDYQQEFFENNNADPFENDQHWKTFFDTHVWARVRGLYVLQTGKTSAEMDEYIADNPDLECLVRAANDLSEQEVYDILSDWSRRQFTYWSQYDPTGSFLDDTDTLAKELLPGIATKRYIDHALNLRPGHRNPVMVKVLGINEATLAMNGDDGYQKYCLGVIRRLHMAIAYIKQGKERGDKEFKAKQKQGLEAEKRHELVRQNSAKLEATVSSLEQTIKERDDAIKNHETTIKDRGATIDRLEKERANLLKNQKQPKVATVLGEVVAVTFLGVTSLFMGLAYIVACASSEAHSIDVPTDRAGVLLAVVCVLFASYCLFCLHESWGDFDFSDGRFIFWFLSKTPLNKQVEESLFLVETESDGDYDRDGGEQDAHEVTDLSGGHAKTD